MDRIVEVVAGPVAAKTEQAWAQLLELRRDEFHRPLDRGPGEELSELYRQLLARYPPFEDDPSTPWGESLMILYFGDRLAAVPIIESRVAEALPFVITTALGLGLTVFDVTGEHIHRPEGKQALPASLTAQSPWRDRLDEHPDRSAFTPPPGSGPEEDPKRTNRATMMMSVGCLLIVLALATFWTAVMLYSGLATSLAWGEPDGQGNPTTWVRQDVPLLLRIAIAGLLPGAILLIVGARRMMRITAARRAAAR